MNATTLPKRRTKSGSGPHGSSVRHPGFTLVELLIVIVVIAILAAIAIISYQGIQQRAVNTSIKSDAAQVIKLLMVYQASEGAYPMVDNEGLYCVTLDDDCRNYRGDIVYDSSYRAPFVEKMTEFGSLPRSSQKPHSEYYGLSVSIHPEYTIRGRSSPVMMVFFLKGKDQDCRQTPAGISVTNNTADFDYTPSRNSNPDVKDTGTTRCYLMLPPN